MTYDVLYRGCLLGAIAHAIMTNVYPDFSYEQSWDDCNYSFISDNGIRGTISFYHGKSVGAIRNDNDIVYCGHRAVELINSFPSELNELAIQEAFQYLLEEIDGKVLPCVSFAFYCDELGFSTNEKNKEIIDSFISVLQPLMMNTDDAIKYWSEYYEMDESLINLTLELLNKKLLSNIEPIFLSKEQIKMFPGDVLCDECIESLNELNIYVQ